MFDGVFASRWLALVDGSRPKADARAVRASEAGVPILLPCRSARTLFNYIHESLKSNSLPNEKPES